MKRLHWLILGSVVFSFAPAAFAPPSDPLETSFQHPPASARPWVYWFPLSGNLTQAGITADLEAMARVGIGGALYMEVDQGTPKGAADFAGPLWLEMFSHTCREAKRLGLEINFNNDAGWNGSGGPWITPELSMQKVVWSETVMDHTNKTAVVLPQPSAVKDYYEDIAVLAMPAPTVDRRIPEIESKSSSPTQGGIKSMPPLSADFKEAPVGGVISRNQIINLTGKMNRDGKLNWTPPAGQWLVMRFGHTATGKENHPAPASGRGLECDKLSPAAATFHFEHLMGKLVQQNRALTGQDKTLVAVHIDSWENGAQNWTPLMRRGISNSAGAMISCHSCRRCPGALSAARKSPSVFYGTCGRRFPTCIVEHYAGTFRKLANQNGLRLTIEAYGEPADDMAYAGQCDEPMGEFWEWSKFGAADSCTEMTSAGHTYGKRIIGAEAFTSNDRREMAKLSPATSKTSVTGPFAKASTGLCFTATPRSRGPMPRPA